MVAGFDLKAYLKGIRRAVDASLNNYLDGPTPASRIYQAMHYSVMAGGKRLRPVLCIAAARTIGGRMQAVLPVACALECIHTYSLIHDDLPAMDDDALRRGHPTCHVKFDEATAILAGDGLLTLAFEILADAARQAAPGQHPRWMRVFASVAMAAGARGMIEGQMRDMISEGTVIPSAELETLHRLKTGKMIEVSVSSGAEIAGATPVQLKAFSVYAENIGLAFQVTDDLLNVNGDPALMGKAAGTDQRRGKNTYPSLLGLAEAEAYARRLVDNALKALDGFDNQADPLRALAGYIIERKR